MKERQKQEEGLPEAAGSLLYEAVSLAKNDASRFGLVQS